MTFTKNKGMYLIVVFIVLALLNVIAFSAPFNREGNGFWVGYSFSMLAVVVSAAVGLYAIGREGKTRKFYGLPLANAALIYLIIQLIMSLAEMAVPSIPLWISVVANVVLLGVFLIGIISANAATEEIERLDTAVKEKVFFIKSLQGDIEGLVTRAPDEATRKSLKDLAETIRYSDPMSSPQLAALENKIEAKSAALAENIADANTINSICTELQQLFAERNRKCKLLK